MAAIQLERSAKKPNAAKNPGEVRVRTYGTKSPGRSPCRITQVNPSHVIYSGVETTCRSSCLSPPSQAVVDPVVCRRGFRATVGHFPSAKLVAMEATVVYIGIFMPENIDPAKGVASSEIK